MMENSNKNKGNEPLPELITPGHTRRDLRQLESAINKGWEIPDALLRQLPLHMARIVAEGSRREAINATRVIVAMQRQNQPQVSLHAHQHTRQQDTPTEVLTFEEKRDELRERIKRLASDRGN